MKTKQLQAIVLIIAVLGCDVQAIHYDKTQPRGGLSLLALEENKATTDQESSSSQSGTEGTCPASTSSSDKTDPEKTTDGSKDAKESSQEDKEDKKSPDQAQDLPKKSDGKKAEKKSTAKKDDSSGEKKDLDKIKKPQKESTKLKSSKKKKSEDNKNQAAKSKTSQKGSEREEELLKKNQELQEKIKQAQKLLQEQKRNRSLPDGNQFREAHSVEQGSIIMINPNMTIRHFEVKIEKGQQKADLVDGITDPQVEKKFLHKDKPSSVEMSDDRGDGRKQARSSTYIRQLHQPGVVDMRGKRIRVEKIPAGLNE